MKIKILCFFAFLSIGNVHADCGYELSVPVLTYGVADTNPTAPGTVSLTRKKDNGIPCSNFFLAFTKGSAGNYNRRAVNPNNGDLIYYNLYKNSNSTGVLKEANDATSSNEVLHGTVSKDETKELTYNFTLAPLNANSPPRSGMYVDIVQVQAYSGFYTDIRDYEGFRDLNIYINVPKYVSLSLVDAGEVYDESKTSKTLDFGELEESEQLSFDVRVVANAGYILSVSSSNNGLLKRIDGSGPKSEISYGFYVNNSKKSLSSSAGSPVTIASAPGRTPSGGAQVPVRVAIESVDDKDPGNYQDYITLSVISND